MKAPRPGQTTKQAQAAKRKRSERERTRNGIDLVRVPLKNKNGLIEYLVDSHWISLENSDDDNAVGRAIGRILDDLEKYVARDA